MAGCTPRLRTTLSVLALAALASASAHAAGPTVSHRRVLANPPAAKPNAQQVYDLNTQMTNYYLYNPNTGSNDQVRLRTYWMNSGGSAPNSPLVGPTIETKPGQTVAVELHNKLEGNPGCKPDNHNVPKCFDLTNFHTHGFWVTPGQNPDGTQGDNVMITLDVGANQAYRFNLPPDHPAGTFWYHAHVHGSTAIQVASGMSGAIIIRGDRPPTLTTNGDIDTLLAKVNPKERILLFQQISYACGRKDGKVVWACAPGQTGTIDGYDQIGKSKWTESGRFTSINGQVLPEFPGAVAGKTERWRMIHGGIANSLYVFIRKAKAGAVLPPTLSPDQAGKWVSDNCVEDVVHQFAYAADGLTRSRIVDRGADRATTMQPGYREDVLLTFPKPGLYCVIDTASSFGAGQGPENRALLGVVNVAAGTNVGDQHNYLQNQLMGAASFAYPAPVAGKVQADLMNGMRITMFQPHKSLTGEPNVGKQDLSFTFTDDGEGAVGNQLSGSDAVPYNGTMSRSLTLGTTDQWTLTALSGGHPFHIHVNPYQIVEILDPSGKDVSVTGEPGDMQYADLKDQWKDTIFIKPGYKVVMRTHYERYDGVFVLHCHILDHEDTGMMQKIQICKPGDKVCLAAKNAPPMHGMH
ncbi:MAG: multicopper oxidase domain-containing protein [Alphaproteobacteria bacterium]|nr:multicopper oxidase domain-containing protein [Alphaproteobacteria bacterium]